MRYLGCPTDDGKILFGAIASAKRAPNARHLVSITNEVFDAYDDYLARSPDVNNVNEMQFSDEEKAALLHAYEVSTAPLSKLRNQYLRDQSSCPFCGLSESATLYHYGPKESYPQYAVFPQNLIPCCDICNRFKWSRIMDEETNVRLFIHPYFDDLPNDIFLAVKINIKDSALGLNFHVVRSATMSEIVFSQINHHFRLLNLSDRYFRLSIDELRGHRLALDLQYKRAQNADDVSAFLLSEANSRSAAFGKNNWRVVLYSSLASNIEFCNGGFRAIPK